VARSSPAISRQSLRSLRLQVSVALAVAAAACAFVASKSSSDELQGAYRDSARKVLRAGSLAFERSHDSTAMESPDELRKELRGLLTEHPEIDSASIYLVGGASTLVSAGQPARGRSEMELALEALSSG
jgi:predicted lysophospholipase L1 biosynthesis ABC-type transport system permease subunit